MIDIFMTSFYRADMTKKTINLLRERTTPGSYQLHVFDNASDRETRNYLYSLLEEGTIASLHLDSRNTGCLYNKAVFHSMTESKSKYYIVTDNDIYPPKLTPDWLSQMVAIMDKYPQIAFLTPQIPPVQLMMPEEIKEDVVFCKAVGNVLKLIRTEAFPTGKYTQQLGAYGDDGMLSDVVRKNGWRVAFCRKIFIFHAGQCENWGYKPEEIAKDPRKIGYGAPLYTTDK